MVQKKAAMLHQQSDTTEADIVLSSSETEDETEKDADVSQYLYDGCKIKSQSGAKKLCL